MPDREPPVSALLQAVRDGEDAGVAALLAGGADVNPPGGFAASPLVEACRADELVDIARRLLDAGAAIDVIDEETGRTPLFVACEEHALAVARLLVERGAQVNLTAIHTLGRVSPLMLAAWFGDAALCRLLLAHGADPERFADADGRRAIHFAADGELACLEVLLEYGADIWTRTGQWDGQRSVLDIALGAADKTAAAYLYRHIDERHPNVLGSLLHAYAVLGDCAGAQELVAAGVPVDVRDGGGQSPLQWAVCRPKPELAALILASAGRASACTRTPETQKDMVDLLLRLGADIDACNANGAPLLCDALAWGDTAIAEQLVRAGANIALPHPNGWTPLLLAARALAPPSLLSLLFARGADPKATQNGAWNALTYAAHNAQGQAAGLATVACLVEHGVPVNAAGFSPLHAAARWGDVAVVELLLAAGADANGRDQEDKTPADCARARGHDAVVTRLRAR